MFIAQLTFRITLAICVTSLAGCAPPDPTAPAPSGTSYEFGFTTIAGSEISDTTLYMDRHGERVEIAGGGSIGARSTGDTSDIWRHWGKKGHLPTAPARIPENVFLTWFDHRGAHEQAIKLAGIVPDMEHFDGTIWFVFDGEQWKASALTKEQTLWRVTHDKGETPVD